MWDFASVYRFVTLKMGMKWLWVYFVGLMGVNFAVGDVVFGFMHREDPCVTICEKVSGECAVEGEEGAVGVALKSDHAKSCCQRGCRFFNLVNFGRGAKPDDFNATKDACEASCHEAYSLCQERSACTVGCTFMAEQRMIDVLSLLSVALYMEEGINPNLLVTSLDLPESEFITDPGLKKELLPGWWDSNGFKLPQTFVRSVPKGSNMVDYNVPSDYSGEMEQPGTVAGGTWLKKTPNDKGECLLLVIMLSLSFVTGWIVMMLLRRRLMAKRKLQNCAQCQSTSNKIVLVYPKELAKDNVILDIRNHFDFNSKQPLLKA